MSHSKFLNRQSLYLRPDPARVVVRPFKPATEPRDFNATDKVRANHIVDRVLRLDPESAAQQLIDVLENFEDRHSDARESPTEPLCGNKRQRDGALTGYAYTAFDLNETTPSPGDLLCAAREDPNFAIDDLKSFRKSLDHGSYHFVFRHGIRTPFSG